MHQTKSSLFAVFLLALFCTGRTNSPRDLIDYSNNQFALDFYQAIRNNTANIVASPIILKLLLALVHQGAEGDTAEEITKVLHHPKDNAEILEAYRAMINELQNPVLKTATKLFVKKTRKINPDFQNVATTYFLSLIQMINFKDDFEGSRRKINAWVERKTNKKIKDFFIEDSLSSETKLAFVSAIHFKARWKHPFKERDTKDGRFYINPKQHVKVKMMSLLNKQILYKDSAKLGAQIVEIPYQENGFRMVLILPVSYAGLHHIESKLVSSDILTELEGLIHEKSDVQMPRFDIESEMDLEEIFKKLGMRKAFTDLAEFSKMSNETMKIDKLIQKALIEVNEEGTEGDASTRVTTIVRQIRFDHPFIFLVMKHSTILLMGRLSNP